MSRGLVSIFKVMVLGVVFSAAASATVVFASVSGSNAPAAAVLGPPYELTNGDFTIQGNPSATLVGNGIDEQTTWTWDFTGHPNFGTFNIAGLTAASMSLTITVPASNSGIEDDVFWLSFIGDFPFGVTVGNPAAPPDAPFQTLGQGTVNNVVVVDLLAYYTPAQIASLYTGLGGLLNGTYHDDAIISLAEITLTDDAGEVPEPSTAVLIGTGLLAFGYLARRRRRA